MFTNLQKHFSVNETRWCPLPWPGVEGIRFEIARSGNSGFQSWVAEQQKSNPLYREMTNGVFKIQMAALTGGKKLSQAATVAKVIDSLDFSGVELGKKDVEGAARYLLMNWEGVREVDDDGEDAGVVEATHDAKVEVFLQTEPAPAIVLPEGTKRVMDKDGEMEWPDGTLVIAEGTPLGEALFAWVMWEAERHEEYRNAWLGEQAKNSHVSSVSS